MGTSEAVLQVLGTAGPGLFSSDSSISHSDLLWNSMFHGNYARKMRNCSSILQNRTGIHQLRGSGSTALLWNSSIQRLEHLGCRCQKKEGVAGRTTEDGNGTWFVDSAKSLNLNGILESESGQQLKQEKEGLMMLGGGETGREVPHKVSEDSVEEEAWSLLRDSIVYYCGSPVGTIAANDPTSSSLLNYDQVFIRDFIPSGVAFLLKGEYDIVRNFILHTLQLQVS